MNAVQLCCWQFSRKKLCSRFSSSEVRFHMENGRFAFLSPPLELTMFILFSLVTASGGLPITVNWIFC